MCDNLSEYSQKSNSKRVVRTKESMAKNTTKPRTKNYRKIIKAAQEEFALKGLNGARMQAIADRAGLPKANIHYYFKDKVTLYTAALNSVMETWNVFFESTEEEVLEPKKTLDQFIRNKVRLAFEDPLASKLFATEIIQGAPHVSEHLEKVMRPWVKEKAKIIQSWIDAGKMPQTDPVLLIFMIWATTQHYADFQAQVLCIMDRKDYDEEMVRQVSDFTSEIILAGCGLNRPDSNNRKIA